MNGWAAGIFGFVVGYCSCAWVVARRLVAVERLARQLRARMDEEGEDE